MLRVSLCLLLAAAIDGLPSPELPHGILSPTRDGNDAHADMDEQDDMDMAGDDMNMAGDWPAAMTGVYASLMADDDDTLTGANETDDVDLLEARLNINKFCRTLLPDSSGCLRCLTGFCARPGLKKHRLCKAGPTVWEKRCTVRNPKKPVKKPPAPKKPPTPVKPVAPTKPAPRPPTTKKPPTWTNPFVPRPTPVPAPEQSAPAREEKPYTSIEECPEAPDGTACHECMKSLCSSRKYTGAPACMDMHCSTPNFNPKCGPLTGCNYGMCSEYCPLEEPQKKKEA